MHPDGSMGGVSVPFGQPPQYPGNQQQGSGAPPAGGGPQPPQTPQQQPTVPPAFVSTPNAEKHLLEADTLRRRQLGSAFLHGSGRTWRDRRRVWPFATIGIMIVAVVIAAIAVVGAFQRQQCETAKQAQRQGASASPLPAQCVAAKPTPSGSPRPGSSATPSPRPASGPTTAPAAPARTPTSTPASRPGSGPGQPGG